MTKSQDNTLPKYRRPIMWERQQRGWHTSRLGGICLEHDGWHFWPIATDIDSLGPFKSLAAAKRAAEDRA